MKRAETDQRLLDMMPSTFTRQMLLRAVFEAGMSSSKCHQLIERGTITGTLESVATGYYKKNNNIKRTNYE